jgi:hypothetical protein
MFVLARPSCRAFAVACCLLLFQGVTLAQSANPGRCRTYADNQVDLARRADSKACPAFKSRASQWDGHFNWCMRNSMARVNDEDEVWSAKFDGCMSGIVAATTEKALANADLAHKASASVGSYEERWNKGLRRMADLGMTKPFHRDGYEFQAFSAQGKRWGAGLQKDQQLGFYAVCDTCKGISIRLLDAAGRVIAQEQTAGNAVELIAYPTQTSKGTVEFTVTNCQTRDDSCRLRYTSFTL